MSVQTFESRSDVRKTSLPSFPKNPYDKKGAEIAKGALDRLIWCTKQPVKMASVAVDDNADGPRRPLTDEEANAPYFPYVPKGDGLDGTYILVHPCSSKHLSDGCPLPTCRIVTNGAPLTEVLGHVHDMTVCTGKHEISGSVYFEGLTFMGGMHDERVVLVNTGS
jgi:hypothetical protein